MITRETATPCLDILPAHYHPLALELLQNISLDKLAAITVYFTMLVERDLQSEGTIKAIDNKFRDYPQLILQLCVFRDLGVDPGNVARLLVKHLELDMTPLESRQELRELLESPDPNSMLSDLLPAVSAVNKEDLKLLVTALKQCHAKKILDEPLLELFSMQRTNRYELLATSAIELAAWGVSTQTFRQCYTKRDCLLLGQPTDVVRILLLLKRDRIVIDDEIIALLKNDISYSHTLRQLADLQKRHGHIYRKEVIFILDRAHDSRMGRECEIANSDSYIHTGLYLMSVCIKFTKEQLSNREILEGVQLLMRSQNPLRQEHFDALCRAKLTAAAGLFAPKPAAAASSADDYTKKNRL